MSQESHLTIPYTLYHNTTVTQYLLCELSKLVLEGSLCFFLVLQLLVQALQLILKVLVLVAYVNLSPRLLSEPLLYDGINMSSFSYNENYICTINRLSAVNILLTLTVQG